ncbi:RNA methyltransferase [Erysipelotrichaceae bacterium HCN-30851]
MEQYIVEGNISVKAVLLAKKRNISKIIVDQKKQDKDTRFILRKAKEANIRIETASRDAIDKMAEGKTHGGMIAICGEREFQHLTDIKHKDDVFLALIEGVEDPFNFGYILRTLYAAGCDGVIIPPRNWTSAAGVVTKASAGASEYLNLIVADDMQNLLEEMKAFNIALICGQRNDAISLYDYTFPKKVCIAIGGEMRGLSKLVQSYSNQNLYIPYRQDFRNAMTAASSTAIFAFEFVRQKTK